MNKEQFYACIDQKPDTQMLDSVLQHYPYFVAARVLMLLSHTDRNNPDYTKTFSQVSAIVTDRKRLFNLLNPIVSVQPENVGSEKKDANTTESMLLGTTEATLTLVDESGSAEQVLTIEAEPEANSQHQTDLLDLGEYAQPANEEKGNKEHKPPESTFIDAHLYTLEIPSDFIDDGNYQSLMPSWAKQSEKAPDTTTEAIQPDTNQQNLIDAFIETNPRIVPPDPKEARTENEDISLPSLQEPDDLISEPLARIYLAQGLMDKAISIYEKLSLKFPEKSIYFAGQIEKIRGQKPN